MAIQYLISSGGGVGLTFLSTGGGLGA